MPSLTCLPQTIHLHPNQTLPVKCTLTVLILDCTFLPNAPVCIYIWTNCDPQNVVKSGKYVYACMRRMTSMQGKSLAGLGGTQTPDTLLSKQSMVGSFQAWTADECVWSPAIAHQSHSQHFWLLSGVPVHDHLLLALQPCHMHVCKGR